MSNFPIILSNNIAAKITMQSAAKITMQLITMQLKHIILLPFLVLVINCFQIKFVAITLVLWSFLCGL